MSAPLFTCRGKRCGFPGGKITFLTTEGKPSKFEQPEMTPGEVDKRRNELLATGHKAEAAALDTACRVKCGADLTPIIHKTMDGVERQGECPKCGNIFTYQPPKIAEEKAP